MRQKEIPDCGVERFLLLLDGPWATLIIRELLHGPQRFTELKKGLKGISAHTLTHRLKRFEDSGLVTRTAYAEIPPRVVYELTPLGRSLEQILLKMNSWGLGLLEANLVTAVPDVFVEAESSAVVVA
ncbi:winged helix-turn-helix transcriptional regulator (plasmid) [Agrobacterium sp. rho-13.3]|uniref:winged helix-turn-helix transcriptional regulator n=1 Tax=Agrobacterium sp. rho-13.3 TaxID=3072980 RepID=UPI002A1703A8|nr:helix-turn-helix domain-containing protein [Agrobacterium sp. rho-13.3]MDX8311880.1 helix-turn-helix domain-containing protein [Agrobacterium sp. rho-13.3]